MGRKPLTFALSAGEASGDSNGAALVEAIRRREPSARFCGVGGPRMEAAGVELLYDSSRWGSIGIIQSLKLVLPLTRIKNALVRRFSDAPPDLLIPIDFGYFNVRLAHPLHAHGVRTLYYFPPKSWDREAYVSASLRESVDAAATPFPWSAEVFEAAGTPAAFVGHPLLDVVSRLPGRQGLCAEWNLDPEKPIVALLPGSRLHEVKSIWPELLAAARIVSEKIEDVQFVTPAAPTISKTALEKEARRHFPDGRLRLIAGRTPEVLQVCDAVATCSGTATLEAAVLGKPMVILYRGPALMVLEWRLRKRSLDLKFIGMPNILANRRIVPELIQEEAVGASIAREILSLLLDSGRRDQMRQDLAEAVGSLGSPGAADRTAAIAVALARGEDARKSIEHAVSDVVSERGVEGAGGSLERAAAPARFARMAL